MPLNYGTYVTDLANLLGTTSADTNFVTALNNIIDDAEGRMYREIDLIETHVVDNSVALTTSNRALALSTASGQFVVVEELNVVSPATATSTSGSLNQLLPVSREFLNLTYPSNTATTGLPQFWANIDNTNLLVGPAPDATYKLQVTGTVRPTPLSSGNSSTVLTQLLPDAFMAASCLFGAAYLKNFGAAQDDPKSGVTWEAVYQSRMQSALTEEFRKKHVSQAWTSQQPNPLVQRV